MRTSLLIVLAALMLPAYHASAQLYFPPATGSDWDTLSPASLGWCQESLDSLAQLLDENNSRAFILLKDGKIVLEWYFNGHTQSTPWYWASAGKSLTAFLVGMVQQDGSLAIEESTSTYLGSGWTSCSPGEEQIITVKDQLSMTTGLDDTTGDVECTLDSCLHCLQPPGTRWAYHNAPYTLLSEVITAASGQSPTQYLQDELASVTGITGAFLQSSFNEVFWSTPRSMARFGLLMLGGGTWDGTPILSDSSFYHDMIHPSQALNESYGYLWWLNGQNSYMLPGLQLEFPGPLMPDAPSDCYAALGKNGQFIQVAPSQGMVWIRMGDSPSDVPVPYLLANELWAAINTLACTVTATHSSTSPRSELQLYPNPTSDRIQVSGWWTGTATYAIYAAQGARVAQGTLGTDGDLSVAELPAGMYVLSIEALGRHQVARFICTD